jgi:serine beta-lactamase-like protein LACTB
LDFSELDIFVAKIKIRKRMKMKIAILCFGSLIFLLAGCHPKKEPERFFDYKYKKVLKEARKEAWFYHARNFVPGSSIAVSIDGKLVWSEGIGQASTDLEVAANRHTRYRIGQITQILTSLAYYQLVEKGKCTPTDDFRKFLPEFPEKKYPVLLKNLVSQTSGIRPPNDKEINFRGLNVSYQSAIEYLYPDTLLFEPGMNQAQSFFNFNILGAVIEKAGGEDFQKVITNSITEPLKMTSTAPDNPFITIKGRSENFDRNVVAQVVHAIPSDIRYKLPSEGYLSSAEDLVILGNALLSSPFLSDSVKTWMVTPPVEKDNFQIKWGNGLMLLNLPDGKTVYASRGLIKGSGAILIIIPDEKIVVAWLSNLDDDTEELPALQIAFMFRDFIQGNFGKNPEMNQPTDSTGVK